MRGNDRRDENLALVLFAMGVSEGCTGAFRTQNNSNDDGDVFTFVPLMHRDVLGKMNNMFKRL